MLKSSSLREAKTSHAEVLLLSSHDTVEHTHSRFSFQMYVGLTEYIDSSKNILVEHRGLKRGVQVLETWFVSNTQGYLPCLWFLTFRNDVMPLCKLQPGVNSHQFSSMWSPPQTPIPGACGLLSSQGRDRIDNGIEPRNHISTCQKEPSKV